MWSPRSVADASSDLLWAYWRLGGSKYAEGRRLCTSRTRTILDVSIYSTRISQARRQYLCQSFHTFYCHSDDQRGRPRKTLSTLGQEITLRRLVNTSPSPPPFPMRAVPISTFQWLSLVLAAFTSVAFFLSNPASSRARLSLGRPWNPSKDWQWTPTTYKAPHPPSITFSQNLCTLSVLLCVSYFYAKQFTQSWYINTHSTPSNSSSSHNSI